MDYLAVHIDSNHRGLEPLTAFLAAQDIESLMIEDEYEAQTLETPGAPPPSGDESARVTFYLPADDTGFARLADARIALSDFRKSHTDCGTLLMTLDETKDDDWLDAWKAFWQPTPIGQRLLVVPAWEDAEDEGRVKLFLDPGRTFGSGTHVTTKLCLEAIEGLIHGGEKVADLGCGSGILLLLLLLGDDARHMTGVELRESAAESARENLRAFALEERGEAVCADYRSAPFESESLDFIVSNPPYFPAGRGAVSPNAERAAQRTESATVSELCSASARYLKPGGQFFLVHRRKRESDILAALHNAHLTPVRRRDVFSAPGKRAPIFLMEAVKGAPVSAMRCENVLLRGADGCETEEYRKICHWEA